MVAFAGRSVIVVDCGGDVVQRLLAGGIDLDRIALLFLTHEHPDHIGGFPLFMEKIWLSGRRSPIPVRGPQRAIDHARRIFEVFDTSGWEGMPPIEWGPVALEEDQTVWEDDEWRITASPGRHSVPVLGIRVEDVRDGGSVAYSSDTEGSASIARLAAGADILVHEATGDLAGHASAAGAAEVAREANVERLVLVHLPPAFGEAELRTARRYFERTEAGKDGQTYLF
ncbi:MAG TPA: MBL fold metallo-hydrolase [Longimicrobiaceae bacterium]|nr:MBL fold metallo-hydrolase [Longimicrobiaceae bacterium]